MPLNVVEWDGGPITKAGIYSGVSDSQYHNNPDLFGGEPHLSSSGLRLIESQESSLLHFWHGYVMNPDREKPTDAEHFSFGRAVHQLFLEPEGFREKFSLRPESYTDDQGVEKPWNGNSKVCKAWISEQARKGRSVLKLEELETIKGMAQRMAAHPTIKSGLLNGLVERSIFWPRIVDLDDGRKVRVWLKARPDVLPTDSAVLVDLKTCQSADPLSVRRAITDHGYFQQLALAQEGLWVTSSLKTEEHVLVFQEKKAPYGINIKPLYPSAIHAGHLLNNRAIAKFAKAWADGVWPGYEDDEASCDMMEWRSKQLLQEIKDGRLDEDYTLPEPIPFAPPTPAPALLAAPEFEDL